MLLLASVACLATGCGLNTAVLQKGANGRCGVLLNYSCNASPCDPIDPAKPTIVITHGWNPLPNQISCTFGPAAAACLKRRCGDSYNILSWDWNNVRVRFTNNDPIRQGRRQGRMLARALRSRGVEPARTQMIGHSLGTVVISQAAACLSDRGAFCQLTLLDPPESMHEEIFEKLCPTAHAHCVENYWSPGVSGYGAHAAYSGVSNYRVEGAPHPVLGIVDLGLSNHVWVMRWYHQTICCPSMRCGFQNSCLRKYCGTGGPCCEECPPPCELSLDAGGTENVVEIDLPDDEPQAVTAAVASAGSRRR
jgi:pimeloyl-ACP methyl ester carboxylesterase